MELWSREHLMTLLPAVVIMLLVAVALRKLIGKKAEKIRMLPFQILACIVVAIEIGKQAYSLSKGYDLYCLPFHFCSLFIFMLPIMAFYRGKYMYQIRQITTAISVATTLLTLIYPCLIYSAGNINAYFTDYISFHTVTFHNIVIFICMLIFALDLHTPAPKETGKPIFWFMLGFCIISASMAHILKTNFNNFYQCNIPPLETVRQMVQNALGYVPAQLMYVLIVSVLDLLVVWGSYRLYCLLHKLLTKNKEKNRVV